MSIPTFFITKSLKNFLFNYIKNMNEQFKMEPTQVTGCKKCKNGMNKSQWFIFTLGTYILGTSIYGTVQLIKLISKLF